MTSNKDLIPGVVRRALADTALLFLGFQMDDWNFRVLFRSIMSQEGRGRRRGYAHVAAQIDPEEGRILEPERARRYLESYFQDADISIYWGSAEDFRAGTPASLARRCPMTSPTPPQSLRRSSRLPIWRDPVWPGSGGGGAAGPAHRRAHRTPLLPLGRRQILPRSGRAHPRAGEGGLSGAAGDARQSGAVPGPDSLPMANRYVLSLLLSLEEARPAEQQMPLAELAGMELADYLDRRQRVSGGSDTEVLIFDQFEEILTVDPTDRAAKEAFFAQVGAALRHRQRWALFAMREEYPASLDPYLRPIPTRLSTTYRLELLGEEAAHWPCSGPPVRLA